MIMTYIFQTIIDNQDILVTIARYLPLETKIILERITNKKLFTFYDFSSDDYKLKQLKDLFDDIQDDGINYQAIFYKYEFIQRRKFVENNLDYFGIARIRKFFNNIPLEEFMIKIQYSHIDWHDEFHNECQEKLIDIIDKSIVSIKVKIFTQIVEESSLHLDYDKTLDLNAIIPKNRCADEITKYYLQNVHNLDIFCEKCGMFGHDSLSKTCVMYNEEFENQEVKRDIIGMLENILCKVEVISERIAKNHGKGLIGCKGKWCNRFRSDRCSFNLCKNCCKNKECWYHGKKD